MSEEEIQQARIEHFKRQDRMPKVRRMFINEYGTGVYVMWRGLLRKGQAISLRDFEKLVRKSMKLSATSPVVDEYEKENR